MATKNTLKIRDIENIEIKVIYTDEDPDMIEEVIITYPECYHKDPVVFSNDLFNLVPIRWTVTSREQNLDNGIPTVSFQFYGKLKEEYKK